MAMQQQKIPLSIIVPCFNEQEAIPNLASTLRRFELGSGKGFDLTYVMVDDGSSDRTWELLHRYFPDAVLLRHAHNQGIAGAILSGVQQVRDDYVAVIDSDCTFDPAQLSEMFPLLTDGVDVVSASPTHRDGSMVDVPGWRVAMSSGAAWLYRLVMRQRLSSYTSCFRLFRTQVLHDLRLRHYGFSGVSEILVRLDLRGARFVEFPAVLGTRRYGESKINTLRTIADHLRLLGATALWRWFHIHLRDRPLPAIDYRLPG